ncbi:hypothetical protein MCG98_05910 [Ruminococcus sp. OA3]|uniref:hypothetical protein n=1 Tax=Ruminococcus sp. OA3 TaxID=2914164 RepID=UPI001F05E06C|nr:hypothetical protein [Ruminococcus sp. OA3]MCH1982098.1 hypothetical protein [Ruminococcus sp. OA3]
MKKRIISILLMVSLLAVTSITAMASQSDIAVTKNWGHALQKYVDNQTESDNVIAKSLEETEDNTIILPQSEIDIAKEFYTVAGYGENEALQLAIDYVKEINTLYQEAIKNGYAVTEEDIMNHLDQMKVEFRSATNKEEIYSFINEFDSEQAYWDFQFEMFKKDLPIQRYNADIEKAFFETNILYDESIENYSEEEYSDTMLELEEDWLEEFENMKNIAENEYSYIIE